MKTIEAALQYSAKGWKVLPVHGISLGKCTCQNPGCSAAGKHPANAQGVKGASTDETQVRSWFDESFCRNVGIATGGGIFVLDIDDKNEGSDSLEMLEREYGALPETVQAFTGAGRHLYFRLPIGKRVCSRVGVRNGIDIRADGAYVVAPPSIHRNGRRYVWDTSGHPDDVPLALVPDWLVRLTEYQSLRLPKVSGEWKEILDAGKTLGSRNDSMTRIVGHLLARGVHVRICADLVLAWNRQFVTPPQSDSDVIAIVQSLLRKEFIKRSGKAIS